jgi:uncharacterized membrane protein
VLLRRDLTGVRDELLDARYWAVLPCMALSVVGLWLRVRALARAAERAACAAALFIF